MRYFLKLQKFRLIPYNGQHPENKDSKAFGDVKY
jgi:hypothetical protein